MQTYDYLMLFILGGLTLYGYAKGMAWQVAYLTSFFVSYFVAVKFSNQLAPVFGDAAPWNKFAAMAAIYIGFSLITWMVFRVIRGGINKVKLQSFDRQMGALVGAARGVLWCVGVTFFAVTLLPDNTKQQIIGSQSGRYIAKLLDKADVVFPQEIHQVLDPHLNRLEQELNGGQSGLPGFPQPSFPLQGAPSANQFGWPQAGGQNGNPAGGQTSATNSGGVWPSFPTQAGQQSQWPTGQQPAGTPARPAAWPNQPQPANPWPRQ